MRTLYLTASVLLLAGLCQIASADENVADQLDRLEASGTFIGDIELRIGDVFDTSLPKENKSVFRLANRLHINTRRSTILSQLMFRSGDRLTRFKIEESARLLRANRFLANADVRVKHVTGGIATVEVITEDNWTLVPQLSLSRSGGESRSQFGIEEQNLLGTGTTILLERRNGDDRESTLFGFSDRNVGRTWVRFGVEYRDNSDGDASAIALSRPFFSLDTRWAASAQLSHNDRQDPLFSRGKEIGRYQHDQRYLELWYGLSGGLNDNRVGRWVGGIVIDDNAFSALADQPIDTPVPAERELRYPFVEYRYIENQFALTQNFDQILRPEDVYIGSGFRMRVGALSRDLGADRNGIVFDTAASTNIGHPDSKILGLAARINGRVESAKLANTRLQLDLSYHRRQSPKRMLFGALRVVAGKTLDIDNPVLLGGNTGLRGYPRAFGNGDSRAVLTVEQRYYTDWYPFRLFRVGAAVFLDIGRVWGQDNAGRRDDRILSNAGIGLRLGATRGNANKIVHIDLAFALRDDPNVDAVQLLVEAKRGF